MGQGPVVTVSPNHLHWGEMPLLEESVKTLIIANESPIPTTVNLWLVSLTNLITHKLFDKLYLKLISYYKMVFMFYLNSLN